jgi:type VI secretion system protein ImpA
MDVDKLISAISPEAPTGVDCAYLPGLQRMAAYADYLSARAEIVDLERLAKIEYEGENSESDRKGAAANLDDGRRQLDRMSQAVKDITGKTASTENAWSDLVSTGEKMLMESGKDIRVVHFLTFGLMGTSSLEGLGDGFNLIDWLLETYGPLVYPRPEEDDQTDQSAREMVVAEMLSGHSFVNALGQCVILEAPRVGRLTVRDVEVIEGRLEDDKAGGARTAQEIRNIGQCLAETASGPGADPNEALGRAHARVNRCLDAVVRVTARFSGESLGSDRVTKMLERVKLQLETAMSGTETSIAPPEQVAGEQLATVGSAFSPSNNGMVLRTRNDARKMILEISRFLEETEPSHPAPLFLKRAERLLGARDFFEIVNDMAPDSVSEIRRITGHRDVSES